MHNPQHRANFEHSLIEHMAINGKCPNDSGYI
jgi:hypothetical protein